MVDHTDRLQRLGDLLALLLTDGPGRTRAEIVDRLPFYAGEHGRRRLTEDKAALERAGIPVELAGPPEAPRYAIRPRSYRMPALDLTEDEMAALELATATVGFDRVSWAQLGSARLDLPGLRPALLTELPGLELLPTIDDAVLTRTCLDLTYGGTARTVEPWGVVFKHGRWYLVGFDRLRADRRCFRVDRIDPRQLGPGEGPGAFDPPAGLDLGAEVPDDPLTMGEKKLRTARVRVDRRIAPLLPGLVVDGHQDALHDEPTVVIELQVSFEPAFISWVLGWGELAEVLDPPDLRRAVIDRLRELAGDR